MSGEGRVDTIGLVTSVSVAIGVCELGELTAEYGPDPA